MTTVIYSFPKPIKPLIAHIPSIPKLVFSKNSPAPLMIILCTIMRCHKSDCYLAKIFKYRIIAAAIYSFPKPIKPLIAHIPSIPKLV